MLVELMNGCMKIDVRFEHSDSEYDDNVCLHFTEPCHDDERVFRAAETNLYLTAGEARKLANALLSVAEDSDYASTDAA